MVDESPPEQPSAPTKFLRWPPPGLERMQGDLWRVASRGALAGGLLVLPLLFVVAREQEFASLGPFADAWWVTLVLTTVGLGFAMDAFATTGRILQRLSQALERGYDVQTVAFVLSDLRRDMGFLLQGGRHFGVVDARERHAIAGLRVFAVFFHAMAGLWLPLTLGVGLLAAARGIVDAQTLWMVTLLPAALFYLFGAVAGATEDNRVRRARREWHKQPWASDLVTDEIRAWRSELSDEDEPVPDEPAPRGSVFLRRGSLVVGAIAVLIATPVLTLVPASAIGPVLAAVSLPSFGQVQVRAARAEAFRPYVVEKDESVSAQEAGQILQDLLFVGFDRPPSEGMMQPSRRIEAPWIEGLQAGNPIGAEPHRWAETIFETVDAGMTPEVEAYLATIAAHEALELFARLARAEDLDAASARWLDPLPASMTMADLPIPRFSGLRSAAYATVGAAAYEFASGRSESAETMLREVISVGLLLGDQGPTLIDNLIGHMVARTGGVALGSFFEANGRTADAAELTRLLGVAERASDRIYARSPEGVEAYVRSLPDIVTDESALRGLRWEMFVLTATLTPCLNLKRMVFGPEVEYSDFLEAAHASLVRWPSEEALYGVARGGYFGASSGAEESLLGRVFAVSMRSGEGACGDIVRRFDAIEELF